MHFRFRARNDRRKHRHARVRAKVFGTSARPRLSVFRSLRHVFLQIVNDERQVTLVAASDKELTDSTLTGIARSHAVGKLLAEKARAKGIAAVVFDRGGYRFHGHLKAVAEGARMGGLVF